MEDQNLIAITSDIDWANDEILKYMLSILDEYKVKITFFGTHEIKMKEIEKHELGIHPNFIKERSDEETIQNLMSFYPQAKGTRSHMLYRHSGLLQIYQQVGLEYESNFFIPNQIISPFFLPNDILELPIFFADDYQFLKSSEFDQLNIGNNGMKIFNFHPIHIFLNTDRYETYENAKKYLKEPLKLEKFRNINNDGTKEMFIHLLNYLENNGIDCVILKQISDSYRSNP